jgi:hypothetical protein
MAVSLRVRRHSPTPAPGPNVQVGYRVGSLCTNQPRYEFPLFFRYMPDFSKLTGIWLRDRFLMLIVTNLGMHSESSSAIDDPIKSRIPNRRQSLSRPLWLQLRTFAFVCVVDDRAPIR